MLLRRHHGAAEGKKAESQETPDDSASKPERETPKPRQGKTK